MGMRRVDGHRVFESFAVHRFLAVARECAAAAAPRNRYGTGFAPVQSNAPYQAKLQAPFKNEALIIPPQFNRLKIQPEPHPDVSCRRARTVGEGVAQSGFPCKANLGAPCMQHRLAAFARTNMPFGLPGTLGEQQAWDVTLFMTSRDRPQDPRRYASSVQDTRHDFHDTEDSTYGREIARQGRGAKGASKPFKPLQDGRPTRHSKDIDAR